MSVLLWVLVVLAVVVVPVVVVGVVSSRGWGASLRRRVVVVLDTGRTIEGVLFAKRGPLLVLRDVVVHVEGAKVPADGEMLIERARIEWVQVVA